VRFQTIGFFIKTFKNLIVKNQVCHPWFQRRQVSSIACSRMKTYVGLPQNPCNIYNLLLKYGQGGFNLLYIWILLALLVSERLENKHPLEKHFEESSLVDTLNYICEFIFWELLQKCFRYITVDGLISYH
jgi:hypothetical protein